MCPRSRSCARCHRFRCHRAQEPVVDFETKRPRADENGEPLFAVQLVALAEGTAEIIAVKVAGTAPAVRRASRSRCWAWSPSPGRWATAPGWRSVPSAWRPSPPSRHARADQEGGGGAQAQQVTVRGPEIAADTARSPPPSGRVLATPGPFASRSGAPMRPHGNWRPWPGQHPVGRGTWTETPPVVTEPVVHGAADGLAVPARHPPGLGLPHRTWPDLAARRGLLLDLLASRRPLGRSPDPGHCHRGRGGALDPGAPGPAAVPLAPASPLGVGLPPRGAGDAE
jgi:hypothetical protein